jgi:AraC family transcriptional regulator
VRFSSLDISPHSGRDASYDSVAKVVRFLSGRLDESLSLSEIAASAATSRFHFNRRFRKVTGIPPCRFLYAMRLAAAKALLLTTRRKVIDVCYEVGYNSLGTFTRRFTELVGVSPSRFRNQAKSLHENVVLPWNDTSVQKPPRTAENMISGSVLAPDSFQGFIFVGLFCNPIAQGRPVACTIINSGGPFHLSNLVEGTFYLFALAIPMPITDKSLFDAPTALRAGGQRITVGHDRVDGSTELALRPPQPIDPPILVALHPMLSRRATNAGPSTNGRVRGNHTDDISNSDC